MSDPFLGEIRTFGFDYAPYGWAFCNGSVLALSQNSALYALLGARFGGDGRTTFQLPNLASRMVCGAGAGTGLTPRQLGEIFGESEVTLTTPEMAAHSHSPQVWESGEARSPRPSLTEAISATDIATLYGAPSNPPLGLHPNMLSPVGGGAPHENRQPAIALNFCIALTGDYPSFP